MQHTKIAITKEEYDVMTNSDFLLKKVQVIQKIKFLLLQLQEELTVSAGKFQLPVEVLKLHGKISSGENYSGLPYLILDYPRYFDKENVFAFRSMFWWGNYFLFTLHLQGEFFNRCKENLFNNLKKNQSKNFYINTSGDVWKHHIGDDNLIPLKEADFNFEKTDFIKIAKRLELERWEEISSFGNETFLKFMEMSGADKVS